MSLHEQHNTLEARIAAIRQQIAAEGRKPTADETVQLNELSIERAGVYRAWQEERSRTEPSNIIAGSDVFRQSMRKRQLQCWALAIVAAVILGGMRYERYDDGQAVDAGYTAPHAQTLTDERVTNEQQALFDVLPPVTALPEGFELSDEWPLTLDDLTWEGEDGAARRHQLISWGFENAVYRYYVLPEDRLSEGVDGLYDLDVELTEYGSREQALDATEVDQAGDLATSDVSSPTVIEVDEPIGDLAIAHSEPYVTYGAKLNWVTLWVIDGPLQYCFRSIASEPGLPPALIEIAKQTVALN